MSIYFIIQQRSKNKRSWNTRYWMHLKRCLPKDTIDNPCLILNSQESYPAIGHATCTSVASVPLVIHNYVCWFLCLCGNFQIFCRNVRIKMASPRAYIDTRGTLHAVSKITATCWNCYTLSYKLSHKTWLRRIWCAIAEAYYTIHCTLYTVVCTCVSTLMLVWGHATRLRVRSLWYEYAMLRNNPGNVRACRRYICWIVSTYDATSLIIALESAWTLAWVLTMKILQVKPSSHTASCIKNMHQEFASTKLINKMYLGTTYNKT